MIKNDIFNDGEICNIRQIFQPASMAYNERYLSKLWVFILLFFFIDLCVLCCKNFIGHILFVDTWLWTVVSNPE